jgi:cell division protein FtsZ
MINAFAMINDVLSQSVTGISDIITKPGHINVDFADVRAIMKDMGMAIMGTARASGEGRARQAALKAISSPVLENMNIKGSRGVLLNITGGPTLGLHEISEAASVIYEQVDEDANIILGSVIDESLADEVTVTVIATGFDIACPLKPDVQINMVETIAVNQSHMAAQEIKKMVEPAPVALEVMQADEMDINDLDTPAFMRKAHEHNARDNK